MIDVVNVAGGYPQNTVFEGISFTVKKGRVCVLLGGNGSGKSTLLKTIAGLLPLKSGTIKLDGQDIGGLTAKQRAKLVASMMQRNTSPQITVESLVLHGRYPYLPFPRKLSKNDEAIASASMAQLGMTHLKEKTLPSLSGGELQKAYLAMALTQDTPVLLLDEPNAYLDIHHQRELFEIIKQLKQNGKTIIAALHDIPGALEIADMVCVLYQGRQIYMGPPGQLVTTDIFNRVFDVKFDQMEKNGRKYYSIW